VSWGWRRVGLLLLVAPHQLVCAIAAYHISETADAEALMPLFWPAMFAVSAALVIVVAVHPTARGVFIVAGAAAATALATLPLGTLGNYLAGFTPSGWSVVLASLLLPPYAALALWWWVAKVGPWQVRHQVGATIGGD
jgi:hypothetical protein